MTINPNPRPLSSDEDHQLENRAGTRGANHPDARELSAQDRQQLAEQGYVMRVRDKMLSAVMRGVIGDPQTFTDEEKQTFWQFFPLRKNEDGTLPNADQVFSDERLQIAWRKAISSRKEATVYSDRYALGTRHTIQTLQEAYESRKAEKVQWDIFVALGKLPDPKQLKSSPILHGLFVEQAERYIQQQEAQGEPLYFEGAITAWEEAKRLYGQHLIAQSKRAMGTDAEPTTAPPTDDPTSERQPGINANNTNTMSQTSQPALQTVSANVEEDRDDVYVPSSPAALASWQGIWRQIKEYVDKGITSPKELKKLLGGAQNLGTKRIAKTTDDKMYKIIRAGLARKL